MPKNNQQFLVAHIHRRDAGYPTFAAIEPVRSFNNASLTNSGKLQLAPDAEVFRDRLGCFRRFVELDHAHTVLETDGGRAPTEVKARAG